MKRERPRSSRRFGGRNAGWLALDGLVFQRVGLNRHLEETAVRRGRVGKRIAEAVAAGPFQNGRGYGKSRNPLIS